MFLASCEVSYLTVDKISIPKSVVYQMYTVTVKMYTLHASLWTT